MEKPHNWMIYHHCISFEDRAFVYAWGTLLLIACNSNGNNVLLLNDTWNQDCVNQRRRCNLNRVVLLKNACVLLMNCGLFTPLSISLDCRWEGETQSSLSRGCSVNCCTIKSTIYPQFIPLIPTVLEHFGAVWSLHDSGEDWESLQRASPHSTPSSFPCVHF